MKDNRVGLVPFPRDVLRRGPVRRPRRSQAAADEAPAPSSRERTARERGSSAIELAILAPALLIISALIIQWALWFEARGVALSAAQQGARIARVQQPGWPAQSVSQARSFYDQVGTHLISGLSVTLSQTGGNPPDQVYVTVKGSIPTLIPLISPLTVTEKAGGPVECFRPDQPGSAAGGTACG